VHSLLAFAADNIRLKVTPVLEKGHMNPCRPENIYDTSCADDDAGFRGKSHFHVTQLTQKYAGLERD